MATYEIQINVSNPVTGESRLLKFQFDPATLTSAKWDGAYVQVSAAVNDLLASAVTSQPPAL